MLEFALEKFPVETALDRHRRIHVRPLVASDEAAFQRFHLEIPEVERLVFKHRVTDSSVFHEWCRNIDYQSNLPLLALDAGSIVGAATLHQRCGGWKRHIGLLSVLIHPDHRGSGIVNMLVNELVEIARHSGLSRIEAEFVAESDRDIRALGGCGFRELVRLPDYVQDIHGQTHEYVLMGMNLMTNEELAGVGD